MKLKNYGKYFQHNMRLFTTIFILICVAVTSFYLYNSIHYQLDMIKKDYESGAYDEPEEEDSVDWDMDSPAM